MKALIVIDVQNGLTMKKPLYNKELFLNTINSAIKKYRKSEFKIIFIQHNNNQMQNGTDDWDIDQRLEKRNDDMVIQKHHGNAFQNTNLKQILNSLKVQNITICGLVSHGCIRATCLGALSEGFKTSLLKNGHTNWNKDAKVKIEQTENELKSRGVEIEGITT